MNLDYFFSGLDINTYKYMGVHPYKDGVEFYLWAPHAFNIEVIIYKDDSEEIYPLKKIDERGIWHLIIEDTECIYSYRYRIYKQDGTYIDKSDPYATFSQVRPDNASIMYDLGQYQFSDNEYLDERSFDYEKPLNIYELYPNSFKQENNKTTYQQLRKELIPYVKSMGYSHIELMPIIEHPYDGSWGYQATGYFSITSRYGTPWDFMDFVNECHLNNIGVILDVSYLHFAIDTYGLSDFDGEAVYEYEDINKARSRWGSLLFDLGSKPVMSFLLSSANMFLSEYHIDGLRLDCVSDMIYHQGDKQNGLNEEGIAFLKNFNYLIKQAHPDVILIAEDSSDYERITTPVAYDGLGFDYKWDMGWMNDTLNYYSSNFNMREYKHNQITFSMAYFYNEKYLLPFSHDEVVYGKKTIIDKIYGTYEEKFSQCRNLFLYMFTHPGKKLNFAGNDIAMFREFDEKRELDWNLLKYPAHDSFNRFFKDLCHIYLSYKAFYAYDYHNFSFKWIDADNYKQSIYIYARYDEDNCFIVVLNMKPVAYKDFNIGVPFAGTYTELINTDKDIYNGSNMCNDKEIVSRKIKAHGLTNCITVDIAPLAGIIFSIKTSKKAPVLEEPDLIRVFDLT